MSFNALKDEAGSLFSNPWCSTKSFHSRIGDCFFVRQFFDSTSSCFSCSQEISVHSLSWENLFWHWSPSALERHVNVLVGRWSMHISFPLFYLTDPLVAVSLHCRRDRDLIPPFEHSPTEISFGIAWITKKRNVVSLRKIAYVLRTPIKKLGHNFFRKNSNETYHQMKILLAGINENKQV